MNSQAFYDELHARYGNPAKFIKMLRSKMALNRVSQSKLADRAGFQPVRISEWFNGRVDPSVGSMAILDEALDDIINNKGG